MNTGLEARLGQLVDELGDVAERGARSGSSSGPLGAQEYARNGKVFAARPDAASVELRLGSDIAEAARRTPDTSSSARGDDWVRFSPREWDDHASDRLEAWFRVAWRAAGKS